MRATMMLRDCLAVGGSGGERGIAFWLRALSAATLLVLIPCLLSAQEEVLDEDCNLKQEVFDRDWKKYSDLDDSIALESRSWEAQQHYKILSQIVAARLEIYLLKRDMEIDRLMRLELREYKKNLTRNMKVNLLRCFWRLAYVTYDTTKSAASLGDSYKTLYKSVSSIKKVGSVLNILTNMTPSSSRLSIDTSSTRGKVAAVGLSGAVAMIESLADPKSVGKAVYEQVVRQSLPSANLTPEEIEILRTEHLHNKKISSALEVSYRENRKRRARVSELESGIEDLEKELSEWEGREKQRVADALVDACKKRRGGDEGAEPEDVEVEVGELPDFLRGYKHCRINVTVMGYNTKEPGKESSVSGGFILQGEIEGYSGNTIKASSQRGDDRSNIEVTIDPNSRCVTLFECENVGGVGGRAYAYRAGGSGKIPFRMNSNTGCLEAVVTGQHVCEVLRSYMKKDSLHDMVRFYCDSYSSLSIEFFTERKDSIETYRPRR